MKIGLVCPYNIWGGGGVQECVLALQKELIDRNHIVKIITPLPRGYNQPVDDKILTAGMSANVKAFFSTQTQFSASIDIREISKMLLEENFDVLHFHEPWVPMVSRQILARSKSANVATSHAKIPDKFTSKAIANMFNSYTRGLIKYIHAYSAVSEPAAEYVRGFTHEEIKLIPNGIDLSRYTPANKNIIKSKNIVYIGRIEKRKGVKYLIDAFATLAKNDNDINLIIAGEGPLRKKLELYVLNFKIPRVTFLGHISDTEKLSLLNNADLFCSPALYGESFGIVLLEAMAMKAVIVAGNNSGYRYVMQNQGAISLVDPRQIHEFASRLNALLYDQKMRQNWLEWADDYIKKFDYKKVVDQYENLYSHAINKQIT